MSSRETHRVGRRRFLGRPHSLLESVVYLEYVVWLLVLRDSSVAELYCIAGSDVGILQLLVLRNVSYGGRCAR